MLAILPPFAHLLPTGCPHPFHACVLTFSTARVVLNAPTPSHFLLCSPCFPQPPVCTTTLISTAPCCRAQSLRAFRSPALPPLPSLPPRRSSHSAAPCSPRGCCTCLPVLLLLPPVESPAIYKLSRACPCPSSAAHGDLSELFRSQTVRGGCALAPPSFPILLLHLLPCLHSLLWSHWRSTDRQGHFLSPLVCCTQ